MSSTLKIIAWIPIPKPNVVHKYIPILVCHNLYYFVNDVMVVKKIGLLQEGISAYSKNKGCAMLVATELGTRLDIIESTTPSVLNLSYSAETWGLSRQGLVRIKSLLYVEPWCLHNHGHWHGAYQVPVRPGTRKPRQPQDTFILHSWRWVQTELVLCLQLGMGDPLTSRFYSLLLIP